MKRKGLILFTVAVLICGLAKPGVSSYESISSIAADVDYHTGSSSAGITINVPSGRAGIQPNLQLQYSSSLPNGLLGVGWLLEIGSIQRSTKHGVPKYDTTDTFVLTQSGSTQELVDIGAGQYAPEIEGAFMKIEFINNDYWLVTDKNGVTYTFGESLVSREYGLDDSTRILKWRLNRVEDLHGNFMTIEYLFDGQRLYPHLIEYTGNSLIGLSPFTLVEFVYETRPDSMISHSGGFQQVTSKRLSRIDIRVDANLQRKYDLQYTTSSRTSRSLLTSVTQTGSDDITSLPPATFTYQDDVGPTYSIQPLDCQQDEPEDVCFAGDFNGDGLTDIGIYDNTTGNIDVMLSEGETFGPATSWFNIGPSIRLITGDFNGDGLIDVGKYVPASGNWNFALSNGSSFDDTSTWMYSGGWENQRPTTGDFNGDGLTDLMTIFLENNTWYARIAYNANTVGVFEPWSPSNIYIGELNDRPYALDFNGDGLTDVVSFQDSGNQLRIHTNVGEEPPRFPSQTITLTPMDNSADLMIVDGNQDGMTDVGYYTNTAGEIHIVPSDGTTFSGHVQLPFQFGVRSTMAQVSVADFNGDGLSDYYVFNDGGGAAEVAYSDGTYADLLASTDNGVGGVTSISYDPSSACTSTFLPFIIQMATSVTASDSRGSSYTTVYDYIGGLWDSGDREFRGYSTVKVIDPQGNYSETEYLQDDIYKGRASQQRTYDSLGNLFSKTVNTWDAQEVFPGSNFVFLKRKDNFVYDGDAGGRRTAEEFLYEEVPQLGNLTKALQYGEVDEATGTDIPGDTRTVETAYVNNTSGGNYIAGLPRETVVRDNSGDIVRQTWFYYDNNSNITPPTEGLLTKKEDWAGYPLGDINNPVTQYTYDSVGNLLTTMDPLGRTTTIAYDPPYNVFPLTTTNALGHAVANIYYGVDGVPLDSGDGYAGLWGQLKSTTDPNNQAGARTYNVFGDLTATVSPLDTIAFPTQTTAIEYFSNHVKTTTHQRINHGEPETIESVTYSDGLGRVIQSKAKSGTVGQYIVSGQVEYNPRGLPEKRYLNYFTANDLSVIDPIDAGKPHATIAYDAMGRAVQTTNPDGSYSSVIYDDWTTETINENGHKQASDFDAYGRLVEKREYTGADGRSVHYPATPDYTLYASTQYEYGSEGELQKTYDAHGNITVIGYDTLGRKTSMTDPDMGGWLYEYDLSGNLTKQTDAKSQVIDFTYDALNRLTNKTDSANLNVDYTYDDPFVVNSKGRLTQAQYSGDDTAFEYDEIGREVQSIKKINSQNYGVGRNYDALNNLLDIQYPDSTQIFYKYNDAGQIEAISNDSTLFEQQSSVIPRQEDSRHASLQGEKRDESPGVVSLRGSDSDRSNLLSAFSRQLSAVSHVIARSEATRQSFGLLRFLSIARNDMNLDNYEGVYRASTAQANDEVRHTTYDVRTTKHDIRHTKYEQRSTTYEVRSTNDEPRSTKLLSKIQTSIIKFYTEWFEPNILGIKEAYAQTVELITLEAEDMPDKTTGEPITDGWNLSSNGNVSQWVSFPTTATYEFEIIAKGSSAFGEWPDMMLEIDFVNKGIQIVNSSSWNSYIYEVNLSAGDQYVGVAFINDYSIPPDDRNLYVDKVIIREVVSSTLSSPTLNSATAGDGQVDLDWSTVAGATGYKVKYGTASGVYGTPVDVGNVTNHTVTGLTNDTTYYFVVTAYDATEESGNSNGKSAMPVAPPPIGSLTLEVRVASGSDDAEEKPDQTIDLTSSDLELVEESATQIVGLKFNNIQIPQGSQITNAYVQFQVDEVTTATTNLVIRAQASGNVVAFSTQAGDISSRPLTSTSASWSPVAWNTIGEASNDQRTSDIANVIQEVIDRADWSSGNGLAFIITGTGQRTAESYDGDNTGAPLLHIEYNESSSGLAEPVLNNPVAGDTQVDLNWNSVTGATGYKVKYGTTSGVYGTPIDVGNVTNHTVTGLTNGTTYYFVVTAYDATQESGDSNEKSAMPVAPPPPSSGTDYTQDASCEAAYLFDGDVNDSSSHGRHGTLGGATYETNGKFGGSYLFDGIDDYIDVGTFDPSSGDMALVMWVKWQGSTGDYESLIAKRDSWSSSDMRWELVMNFQDDNLFFIREGSYAFFDHTIPSVGTWNHVALVHEAGGNDTLYFNGNVVQALPAITFGSKTDAMLTIGNVKQGSVYGEIFNGSMDEIAIFSRALSQSEIQEIINDGLKGGDPLAAPTLNDPQAGDAQVDLSWSTVSGATGYKVKYGTTSGVYGTPIDVGNVTSHTVTGLINGTTYYFVVTAYDATGESEDSNEKSATPQSGVASPEIFVEDVTYNAHGQVTQIEYGNGVVTTNIYDPLTLRLTRITTYDLQLTTIQDLNYTYDSAGNILSIVDNVNTADQTFTYDEQNRLVTADAPATYGTKSYAYDEIGNIISKDNRTYTYGEGPAGPHAVTSLSDNTTFTYDGNGNMATKQEGTVITHYRYDTENRLTKVEKDIDADSIIDEVLGEYEYDGDGGRVTKSVGGVTTKFIGSLYEENYTRSTKYIFLGDQRVASITNGNFLYYHSDHLGGTNVTTDFVGVQKELVEYAPFGKITTHEKPVEDIDSALFYFTGQRLDDETGLMYYGARYYDPDIGRFITPDTYVPSPDNPQHLNRYTYVYNNPVNFIDPSGNFGFFAAIVAIVKAATIGAAVGAATAAITGGDIGKGAMFGAIAGGVFSGVSLVAQNITRFATVPGGIGPLTSGAQAVSNTLNVLSGALGGAAAGAAVASTAGGNVGQGALIGGGVAAVTGFVANKFLSVGKNSNPNDPANSLFAYEKLSAPQYREDVYTALFNDVKTGLQDKASIAQLLADKAAFTAGVVIDTLGEYYSRTAATFAKYAPAWKSGIRGAKNLARGLGAVGLAFEAPVYAEIINAGRAGTISTGQMVSALAVHTGGIGLKVAGTAAGAGIGFVGGSAVPAIGSTYGAAAGAGVGGGLTSLGVNWLENRYYESLGIR